MAISTRAAQFIKALTRIVWRVVGRRTSLRLVQCTKVNSGIPQPWCCKVYTLKQSATVARMGSNSHKMLVRASAVIPVELRQPDAGSLVLARSADPRGMEAHSR